MRRLLTGWQVQSWAHCLRWVKRIAYVVWGGLLELWTWCKVLFSPPAWFLHQTFYSWCHCWVPEVVQTQNEYVIAPTTLLWAIFYINILILELYSNCHLQIHPSGLSKGCLQWLVHSLDDISKLKNKQRKPFRFWVFTRPLIIWLDITRSRR